MRPLPTTDGDAAFGGEGDGDADFDPRLGVCTLHWDIPRAEVLYFRLVVESWEDLGVCRTMDRCYRDSRAAAAAPRSLLVVLAVPGRARACRRRLVRLGEEVGGLAIPTTPEMRERLRADLLGPDGAD